MIGYLKGTITLRDDPYVFFEVQGVGYKVHATRDVLTKANTDTDTHIYTYTYVREDALELFGFVDYEDLKVFEHLISVSGIGPRTAIQIFSTGNRKDILDAIVNGNVDFFTATPRLGRKNAQKIIIELRTKFSNAKDLGIPTTNAHSEVYAALESIGFSPQEIKGALTTQNMNNLSTEEQIKAVLKNLGK